ncbi:MAG: sigma-54-dependent Fis family transcriptional regulator, partial [Thermoanaerobaculia bacterium]|nr:sigma-54-dependent Fis family transcriptional regulator [Thermoanaerobaculia bacterium]
MSTLRPRLGGLRVLVVDDEADVRLGVRLLVESLGVQVREAESGEQALATCAGWLPQLVITDLVMRGMSGLELLRHLRKVHPAVEVVMITGFGTIELAVEALREGAVHFLCKPFDNHDLKTEVERIGAHLLAEQRRRDAPPSKARPDEIIADDPAMQRVLGLVQQVAPTQMTVLIRGESGTGKEVIARAIHQNSRDPSLPFLAVSAAALPDTLLEAELFGHLKGAFTGADRSREGIFAQARGGTVFLDEISSMSPSFQGKLLRVLQERTVTPLGAAMPKPVDFRLVAATNRRLREMIAAGEFREDLYYRLRVVSINLPPLRQRPADIAPLARHFLELHAPAAGLAGSGPPTLTPQAIATLQKYRWPGNVRELENCIQRALILSHGGLVCSEHLALEEDSLPWSREQIIEALSYEEGKQRALGAYQRRALEGGHILQPLDVKADGPHFRPLPQRVDESSSRRTVWFPAETMYAKG